MNNDDHLISHPFLVEVRDDLTLFNEEFWPRSKQVETGGSGLFGCRAQAVLRLNEVPKSEPDWSWQAFVGHAIDQLLGQQRKTIRPWLLAQERVVYRGIPFSIDEYDPAAKTLTDWKSKDTAQACKEAAAKPTDTQIAQVMGGAAALIEKGCPVETVRLCFLPRAGEFTGAMVWEAEFDREWADAATDWGFYVMELAARKRENLFLADGTVDRTELHGLRDEMPSFCHDYCPWVTTCRGPSASSDSEPPTEEVLDAGHRYLLARADVAEATARQDYWKSELRYSPPVLVNGQRLAWTKDSRGWEERPDPSAVDLDAYEREVEPLPRKKVMVGAAPSLRVTKVKKADA